MVSAFKSASTHFGRLKDTPGIHTVIKIYVFYSFFKDSVDALYDQYQIMVILQLNAFYSKKYLYQEI